VTASRGSRGLLCVGALALLAIAGYLFLTCVPLSECPYCQDPGNRYGRAAQGDVCEDKGHASLMFRWGMKPGALYRNP